MGFLNNLLSGSGGKKNKTNSNVKLERKMRSHGLSEDEKKLVRSGEYDPWNFEEEEMDEDDYYHDDD